MRIHNNVFNRNIKRNIFWLWIVIFSLVLGFFIGHAYANTSSRQSYKPLKAPQGRGVYREDWVSQTTTTTTLPPTRKAKERLRRQVVVPKPIPPAAEWVSQCNVWLTAAGVPEEDHVYAIYIIERESSCSPTVRNRHSSAGGIPQALPWTKMGCPLEQTDEAAVCQIRWMHQYVQKYGGWPQAAAHSRSHGWY